MSEQDSDGEDYLTDEGTNLVSDQVKKILKKKPSFKNTPKSKKNKISLRAQLEKYRNNDKPERSSSRLGNKKELHDHLRELANDFATMNKKFDLVLSVYMRIGSAWTL